MGTFDHRASKPSRGPMDILRWKVLRRTERRAADFAALDAVRPGIRDGGAAALASGAVALHAPRQGSLQIGWQ